MRRDTRNVVGVVVREAGLGEKEETKVVTAAEETSIHHVAERTEIDRSRASVETRHESHGGSDCWKVRSGAVLAIRTRQVEVEMQSFQSSINGAYIVISIGQVRIEVSEQGASTRSMGSRLRVSNRNFAFCLQGRPRFLAVDRPVCTVARYPFFGLFLRNLDGRLDGRLDEIVSNCNEFADKNISGYQAKGNGRSTGRREPRFRLEALSLLLSTYRVHAGSFRERLVISRAASRQ